MEFAKQQKLTEIKNAMEICDRTAMEAKKALTLAGDCLGRAKRIQKLIWNCDQQICQYSLFLLSVGRIIPLDLFEPARNRLRLSNEMAQGFENHVRTTNHVMRDNITQLGYYKEDLEKKLKLTNRASQPEHLALIKLEIPEWIVYVPLGKPQELDLKWKEMNLPEMMEECEIQIRQLIRNDLAEGSVDN